MCDAFVRVLRGRMLFAKNSDRDPNEAQLLEWRPRRVDSAAESARCARRETHVVLLLVPGPAPLASTAPLAAR